MKLRTAIGVLALATAPLAGISAVLGFNVLANPMVTAFTDTLIVRNETDMPIEVTPLEVRPATGELWVLSQFRHAGSAFPALEQRRHSLGPAQHISLAYDGDDVTAVRVLVERQNQAARLCTVPLESKECIIVDLNALPTAPGVSAEALPGGSVTRFWLGLLGFMIPAGLLIAYRASHGRPVDI